MIGAIVGDIAGSRFEFDNCKDKDFELFVRSAPIDGMSSIDTDATLVESVYMDDNIMTLAVADAVCRWKDSGVTSYDELLLFAVESMLEFGKMDPLAGYGGRFEIWLHDETMEPYNSWGNGAAMRVSACGWAGRTLDEVKAMSRAVTEITHNHPEGIKGAEATASSHMTAYMER